jgi:hypothetical protein
VTNPDPETESAGVKPRPPRFRYLAVALLGVAGVVAVLGILVPPPTNLPEADDTPPPAGAAGYAAPPGATASPSPTPSVTPPPVLQLSGPVPSAGPGTFSYARGRGEVLGRAGTLRRFRVALERGTGEDLDEFVTKVDETLADQRSWIGSGRLRLQRVSGDDRHDFTIYLVTARTARRMCAESGVDIRVDGKPYTSCRGTGRVIINLDRWRLSVPHFVRARVPLDTYRSYVLNHEVGHELGHRHERCPRAGRPAPVMMQQTLFLRGCTANPWPYLNGKRYAGPPL